MSEKIRVSLIGLGSMGNAMAHRILDQGFDLDIWNRSPKEIGDLLDKGARKAELQQSLQNDFVISMLSNDAAALEVFNEANLEKAKPGSIHINMSTLSPVASQTLAERHSKHGVGYIAAPVLGRPIAITNGKLLIVAAGAAKDIETASVVFEKVAAQYWNVGTDHSKSNLVKLGVNYNLIHALQAIGESVALVESGGVDPNTFVEILTHTAFSGSAYAGYGPMIVNRKYTPPGFSMALGLKDVKLVEDAAANLGLKLPVATVLHELFEKALVDSELKNLDWSAVAELTRQRKL
ncbi:NAD(P)-dependent oxidoreductase [Rhodoluna lacicola]|uniref:NAD(P)-dependent oxidoreductase n=1 Tax=Rhodoluna lacicola TaxID=529884 RepID=UPI00222E5A54|nr:NAD(P)-dependent oxidoreductase [Rhodoluna lacicola]BDS49875.1 putative oxidoreductase [Rhodoluna lacicola]